MGRSHRIISRPGHLGEALAALSVGQRQVVESAVDALSGLLATPGTAAGGDHRPELDGRLSPQAPSRAASGDPDDVENIVAIAWRRRVPRPSPDGFESQGDVQ